jgi:hypothetical protein
MMRTRMIAPIAALMSRGTIPSPSPTLRRNNSQSPIRAPTMPTAMSLISPKPVPCTAVLSQPTATRTAMITTRLSVGRCLQSADSRNWVARPSMHLAVCQRLRPASAASDVNKEVSTAAQHAGFAGSAKDMKTTQMHLHHVVNCLVDPQGQGFDASFGNPCNGQGSGAISDTTDSAKKASLQQALQQTLDGLKQSDMAAAQKNATAVQDLLKSKM